MTSIQAGPKLHTVIHVRDLTETTYVLRIDRHDVPFRAGQCLSLGVRRMRVNREYSTYSGEQEPYFDLLIREVKGGTVSTALRRCPPGEPLEFMGPYGSYVIEKPQDRTRRYLFIATGTGIAPFRAFVRSYPGLDYKLLHGVRYLRECYDRQDYEPSRYVACVSGEAGGDCRGRVTDYLRTHPAEPGVICYLCGNSAMLAEVFDLLRTQGVNGDQIFTEAFF